MPLAKVGESSKQAIAMPETENPIAPAASRRIALAGLLGVLLVACALVLRPFAIPMVWAVILAYVSWPAYSRLRRLSGDRSTVSALAATLIVALVLVLPVIWLAVLLQEELSTAYQALLSLNNDESGTCLLYTSDAADEEDSVD